MLERERPSTGLSTDLEVSKWVLDTFLSDLRRSHSEPLVAWLLIFCLESLELTERVLNLSGNMVDAVLVRGAFTPIQSKIAENFPNSVMPGIRLLLERGANPHILGMTESSYGASGKVIETSTSLSLRRSAFFHKWRSILSDLGVDWKEFIKNEMRCSPLKVRGWTEETLHNLFQLHFEPHVLPPSCCYYCGREVFHTFDRIEERWETILESIKAGATLGDHLGNTFESDSVHTQTSDESDNDQDEVCWKCGIMRSIRGSSFRREVL